MASLIPWLKFSGAHLVTGLPVASGLAYFYKVGTANAADIYADAEETEPLAQPVVLDAAGRAQVYCSELAEILIQTSTGALVARALTGNGTDAALVNVTWGGSTVPVQTALTAIETSIGSGAQYLEGGTNSVARSIHNVLHAVVTPQDYGAVADGLVDDTVALQRAINRAVAVTRPLYIPTGTYRITAALTAPGALNMYGDGMYLSSLVSTTKAFTALTLLGTGSYVRDLGVDMPHDGDTYDIAISLSGQGITLERVLARGGQGIISTAGATRIVDCVVLFDCPAGSGAGFGISVQDNSVVENTTVTATHGTAAYLTTGIRLYSASDLSTSLCLGGKVTGAYVGGDGGIFMRTTFDTCATGIKCTGPMQGGAFCWMDTCTVPFSVTGTGFYPINLANHFDGTPTYDGACSFQSDATTDPVFVIHGESKVHIFKCTSALAVSPTFGLDAAFSVKAGWCTKIIVQVGAGAIAAQTWGTNIEELAEPAGVAGHIYASDWVWSATKLVQVSAWTDITGAHF